MAEPLHILLFSLGYTGTTLGVVTSVDSDHEASSALTAIIKREDDDFVGLCPEFDIASEGKSIEEARSNLIEALTVFFETAAPSEVARRFHGEVFVSQVDVPVG